MEAAELTEIPGPATARLRRTDRQDGATLGIIDL